MDLDRVNSIFDAIDADKSGEIDPTELMLHLLGVGQEHESVSALFKVLDKDGNGSISREEFIAGFDKLTVAESSEVVLKAKLNLSDEEYAELKADFDEIDTNKSGSVDISEVRTLLTKERNGTAPTEAEVEEMMASFDKDADGQVTLVEYLAALGYAPPDQDAYDDLDAFEPPDQEADLEAAAAAPPVDAAAQLAVSRLESSKVLDENSSVQEIGAQLGLQDDEINELKADFDEMDTDKSGSVDVAEAKASLTKERNGKAPTDDEVQAMMAQFDQNGDAKVTFAEYAAVLCA
jgi:Ca2+-binding EF-hand superfamily protein